MQELGLDFLLHPFGDRVHSEDAAHLDDHLDASGPRSSRDGIRERLVDLDDVDWELAEVAERRIAGTEVVDGDPHSQAPKGLQPADGCFEILQLHVLGDLENERVGRHAGAGENLLDLVDEAGFTTNANTGGFQTTVTDNFQILGKDGGGTVDSVNVTFHITQQPNNLVVKDFDFGTCTSPG